MCPGQAGPREAQPGRGPEWCSSVQMSINRHVHPAGWCSAGTEGVAPSSHPLWRRAAYLLADPYALVNANRPLRGFPGGRLRCASAYPEAPPIVPWSMHEDGLACSQVASALVSDFITIPGYRWHDQRAIVFTGGRRVAPVRRPGRKSTASIRPCASWPPQTRCGAAHRRTPRAATTRKTAPCSAGPRR